MIEVSEAIAAVLNNAAPFDPESIPLLEALGLVLAEDVRSDLDSPPFDKSLVDGFALRLCDCTSPLPVIEVVAAGQVPKHSLSGPAAIQIMTGAPLPLGAEVVVPVELTSQQTSADGKATVSIVANVATWKAGANILRQGSATKRGDLVVATAAEVRPQEMGALAELGRSSILARRRPRVAVLATGDELVPVEQQPGPGQIRNSNETMLCAQIRRAGSEPVPLGIARDERVHLRDKIQIGLQSDVLVLSGGVSMGEKDLVPSELSKAGVQQIFHKVNVKPGKPVWFGVLDRSVSRAPSPTRQSDECCYVFGLPGNPVSSFVCFELFVRPALRRLMGIAPAEPRAIRATLTQPHRTKGDRPTYQPARLDWHNDGPAVTAIPWVGSSDLRATVAANSMALFPIGDRTYEAGSAIEVFEW